MAIFLNFMNNFYISFRDKSIFYKRETYYGIYTYIYLYIYSFALFYIEHNCIRNTLKSTLINA